MRELEHESIAAGPRCGRHGGRRHLDRFFHPCDILLFSEGRAQRASQLIEHRRHLGMICWHHAHRDPQQFLRESQVFAILLDLVERGESTGKAADAPRQNETFALGHPDGFLESSHPFPQNQDVLAVREPLKQDHREVFRARRDILGATTMLSGLASGIQSEAEPALIPGGRVPRRRHPCQVAQGDHPLREVTAKIVDGPHEQIDALSEPIVPLGLPTPAQCRSQAEAHLAQVLDFARTHQIEALAQAADRGVQLRHVVRRLLVPLKPHHRPPQPDGQPVRMGEQRAPQPCRSVRAQRYGRL
ncbi:hypothetical protein LFM09_33780 [Lentzea alba]|uniref:hypothetical protein n=1 Tax=Lentzea alba TaxID=2714351 RepID=UPI0039BFB847